MRFRFLRTILLLTVAVTLVLVYPMYAWSTPEISRAVIASGIIAFANLVLGYFSLELTIDRSNTVFMVAVFGGMGVRMGLILLTVALLVLNGYHQASLVLSLMAFYVISMIAEIIYAARDLGRRTEMARQARRAARQNFTLRTVSL